MDWGKGDKRLTTFLALDCEMDCCLIAEDKLYEKTMKGRDGVPNDIIISSSKKSQVHRVLHISVVNEYNEIIMDEYIKTDKKWRFVYVGTKRKADKSKGEIQGWNFNNGRINRDVMMKNAKKIEEIEKQLDKLLRDGKHILIGHSILNDLRALEHTGIRLPYPRFHYEDIAKLLSKDYFNKDHILGLWKMYDEVTDFAFNIDKKQHNPVYDARATMIVWKHCMDPLIQQYVLGDKNAEALFAFFEKNEENIFQKIIKGEVLKK